MFEQGIPHVDEDGITFFEGESSGSSSELEQSSLSLCCISSIDSMAEQSNTSNSNSNKKKVVNENGNCIQSDLQAADVSVSLLSVPESVVGDEFGNSSLDQTSISLKCYQPCNAYVMHIQCN